MHGDNQIYDHLLWFHVLRNHLLCSLHATFSPCSTMDDLNIIKRREDEQMLCMKYLQDGLDLHISHCHAKNLKLFAVRL